MRKIFCRVNHIFQFIHCIINDKFFIIMRYKKVEPAINEEISNIIYINDLQAFVRVSPKIFSGILLAEVSAVTLLPSHPCLTFHRIICILRFSFLYLFKAASKSSFCTGFNK